MKSVRSFFFVMTGLTFVGVVALFSASLIVLLTGSFLVMAVGQAIARYFSYSPAPKPARARGPATGSQSLSREMRVWNDGKGTIIDM